MQTMTSFVGQEDRVDHEFALGAARYLQNAGVDPVDIQNSLVDEFGLNTTDATRLIADMH